MSGAWFISSGSGFNRGRDGTGLRARRVTSIRLCRCPGELDIEVAAQSTEQPMFHFAYGSNMSVPMMQQRCAAARHQGCAVLRGYRVMIMREGYASIARAPGACVHGVLWRLTARDRAVLDVYEDVAGGLYRAMTMRVVTDRGSIPALVYVAAAPSRGIPRPGYLELVLAAARDAGLPPSYIRDLARLATPADVCQQARSATVHKGGTSCDGQ
jgi:gamma-glutamylcyclotransferase (GGCT)/AIG2-like uncharacterized protein YtfP